jgi:hypothetical protein
MEAQWLGEDWEAVIARRSCEQENNKRYRKARRAVCTTGTGWEPTRRDRCGRMRGSDRGTGEEEPTIGHC